MSSEKVSEARILREMREIYRRADAAERPLVTALGDSIGYGRLMQLAEKIWDEKTPGAAHSVGPCTLMLVPCPHLENGRDKNVHCDWCCGTGRVTERVLQAIEQEAADEAKAKK